MTVRLTRFGGTDWSDGDILYAADQNDTITKAANEPSFKLATYDSGIGNGLIKWTSTSWQSIFRDTADGGLTWTAGGFGVVGSEDIPSNYGSQGVAMGNDDGQVAFCTDAGVTWTVSSTQPANITEANSIHLFNATVGILGGQAGAGNYIWFTTDGGDNWTQSTTGPTAEVRVLVMASATVGYAVDTGKNIWKTTDGGDNWTDTTDGFSVDIGVLVAVDTDTIFGIANVTTYVQKYVNSTNTLTILLNGDESGQVCNAVKATNGYYYWVFNNYEAGSVPNYDLIKWDGTNFYVKSLSNPVINAAGDNWNTHSMTTKNVLIESSANILQLNFGAGMVLEINVIE